MDYNIGDVVKITDKIDEEVSYAGTVRLIEKDEDIPELYWLYIRANNEELNIYVDPRIGEYFTLIEDCSDRIEKIFM